MILILPGDRCDLTLDLCLTKRLRSDLIGGLEMGKMGERDVIQAFETVKLNYTYFICKYIKNWYNKID
jgi:hypothetical protein